VWAIAAICGWLEVAIAGTFSDGAATYFPGHDFPF